MDILMPVLVGILFWSVLMIGVELGQALSDFAEQRRH
jgi:hypothetical protein